MRLAFVALAIFSSSMKAFIRAAVAIALFGAIIIAGSEVARAAGLPTLARLETSILAQART